MRSRDRVRVSFGNWSEEICNSKKDDWRIDINVLPNQGDVWEMFGILWEEPVGKGSSKELKADKHQGLIKFEHTSPDFTGERSRVWGCDPGTVC